MDGASRPSASAQAYKRSVEVNVKCERKRVGLPGVYKLKQVEARCDALNIDYK